MYYTTRVEWRDNLPPNCDAIIIDEFYGWLKYDELLKIMDRYPYQVPVKGGFVSFASKHIVITSNAPIANWYHFDNYQPDAILRRVDLYCLDRVPTLQEVMDLCPTDYEDNQDE